jgi:hypothetical protein
MVKIAGYARQKLGFEIDHPSVDDMGMRVIGLVLNEK